MRLDNKVYIVLRSGDGRPAFWVRTKSDYIRALWEPLPATSVSHAFASQAEGIAYCLGAGLESLPPEARIQ